MQLFEPATIVAETSLPSEAVNAMQFPVPAPINPFPPHNILLLYPPTITPLPRLAIIS
jgi:hypothetical protein